MSRLKSFPVGKLNDQYGSLKFCASVTTDRTIGKAENWLILKIKRKFTNFHFKFEDSMRSIKQSFLSKIGSCQ